MLDGSRLDAVLAQLDPADAELLERHLRQASANAIRRARRDMAIRAAAQSYAEQSPTRRALSLERDLRRYTASGWRRDRDHGPPAQPHARRLYAILLNNGGCPLHWRRLHDIAENSPRSCN